MDRVSRGFARVDVPQRKGDRVAHTFFIDNVEGRVTRKVAVKRCDNANDLSSVLQEMNLQPLDDIWVFELIGKILW
jgi:hypothetical protein